MENRIITIGRQHGSGGRFIGEQLGKALGIPCYDSQLIIETAEESGFAPSFVAANEEHRPSSFLYSLVMGLTSPADEQPLSIKLFQTQSEVIRKVAARGSCIIVGRCADYILRETPGLVNIFVHAPLQSRIQRICQRDHMTAEAAEKNILAQDKERSTYYEFFSGQKWGQVGNYHLSIDTSKIGIDGSVAMIEKYLELSVAGK